MLTLGKASLNVDASHYGGIKWYTETESKRGELIEPRFLHFFIIGAKQI